MCEKTMGRSQRRIKLGFFLNGSDDSQVSDVPSSRNTSTSLHLERTRNTDQTSPLHKQRILLETADQQVQTSTRREFQTW